MVVPGRMDHRSSPPLEATLSLSSFPPQPSPPKSTTHIPESNPSVASSHPNPSLTVSFFVPRRLHTLLVSPHLSRLYLHLPPSLPKSKSKASKIDR